MSIPDLKIVTTSDGSKTIFNPLVGENYHSKHGALQESHHVFLNSGLRYFLADKETESVSVLEVGFGTGLNFLLTTDLCTAKQLALNYVGIEAYPLQFDLIEDSGYAEHVSPNTWQAYKESYQRALTETVIINNFCSYHIAYTELMNFSSEQTFDVIYFDAFASIHQPEMWTTEAIEHTLSFLNKSGVFVTYAITGNLKRIMKSLGMKVEKAPGGLG
ncbi:tRNA (5-methylaminomethyl-2-thiouridylate)-methyltransferase, partial [Pseudoxanthomonas sp. SGD-10]